jgi:hypothetical protein
VKAGGASYVFWLFNQKNDGVLSPLSLPGRIPKEFQKFGMGERQKEARGQHQTIFVH